MWWVIGNTEKTEFVSWSCGQLDNLEQAAVYRSEKNALAKVKQLQAPQNNHYGEYDGLVIHRINPVFVVN